MAIVVSLLLLLLANFASASSQDDLVILESIRQVDLTSHIVRTFASLKVQNTGSSPASEVQIGIPKEHSAKLAFITASLGGQNTELPITRDGDLVSSSTYSITLDKPLEKGQTASIDIRYTLTHALEPLPREIKHSDTQLVLHHDTAYLLSPYPVKKQTSTFRVSGRTESYTKLDSTRMVVGKDKTRDIQYGPYEDVAPMTVAPVSLHFENNSPFSVVKVLEREIEISHWGNIYVTENYHVMHAGARLKGGFSRMDYQKGSGPSAIRFLQARLPPRVHSLYYRDEIGNISTSHVRNNLDATFLFLEPRYPLLGGWQAQFTLGYGLPLQDFVYSAPDGSRYLNFAFGSSLANVVVDKLVVKVVLPEGSSMPDTTIPFLADEQIETRYSYLDTVGRPVVVLTKRNVVPEHNVFFQVNYKLSKFAMLVKPTILVAGFFLFFLAYAAYLRFDYSIFKSLQPGR